MQPPPLIRPPPLPPQVAGKVNQGPILTLGELDRFRNLLVFAKSAVEGYFSGKHKSRFYGASAEFSDYKEYVAGEDTAHIDWRVYGRTRRLFIRQFHDETDMVVYLLVDTSASMRYFGEQRQAKFFLAAKIAAALSYLMIQQGDKAALALFADTITSFLPPGGTRRHLHRIVTTLEAVRPASTTGIEHAITECSGIFRKRGRLVVLSDFLTDTERLFDALGQFMHRKFEILLMQVLDPDELHLPNLNVARFVDMETGEQVQVEPEAIRRSYRETMRQFVDALAREADQRQISYALVDTRNPYLDAIEAYLGFRQHNVISGK
ncbi:MAG TPA: DUF58 domain-containing protein [Verrucomicrobiae bacterium]|jgi:uncharacterized protein (DUF58 family)